MTGVKGRRTVLIGDNLPELGSDLVSALPSLDVNDFAHFCCVRQVLSVAVRRTRAVLKQYGRRAVSFVEGGASPPRSAKHASHLFVRTTDSSSAVWFFFQKGLPLCASQPNLRFFSSPPQLKCCVHFKHVKLSFVASRSPTVKARPPMLAQTRLRGKLGRLFVCF
jgi:hypothetical protein